MTKKDITSRIFLFSGILKNIEITDDKGRPERIDFAINRVLAIMNEAKRTNRSFFFVGNGGSAAIASHMVVDFVNACGIKASTFLDYSMLTCMGNDYGYQNIFAEPIRRAMEKGDVLVAISSSGQSENILRSVTTAKSKGCTTITLSGFKKDNPLRKLGDINFYVPSDSYRLVESAHDFIIHQYFVDFFLETQKN
ncbi:MAG: SIS domain-containing protein [Candidatus Marinimicrobia bacterium]|nr:SIS domain-containing protein [Candidatus Neomarinimicrobiota bacterium]